MKRNRIIKYLKRAGNEAMALGEAAHSTLNDDRTPKRIKIFLLGTLVYLLSPIDLYFDFFPGGLLDDLSLLTTALMVAGNVGREHYRQARQKRGLADQELKLPEVPDSMKSDLNKKIEELNQTSEKNGSSK